MRCKYIRISVFLYLFANMSFAVSPLQKKYPDGLLTDDYEILNEADLLYDINQGNPRPYKLEEFQLGYYRWQCFKASEVTFHYDTWKDSDPLGRFGVIVDLCDFYFKVKSEKISHTYFDRRARRLEFCQEVEKAWRTLSAKQSHVCLQGEPGSIENNKKIWTWNKIKTLKGCRSLFVGDCDTKSRL